MQPNPMAETSKLPFRWCLNAVERLAS
jgi:hypothetical protein